MAVQNSVPGQDPRDPQREEMRDDRAASVVRHEERLVITGNGARPARSGCASTWLKNPSVRK